MDFPIKGIRTPNENDNTFSIFFSPLLNSKVTWLGPLGRGSYLSVRVVRGFRELKYFMFYILSNILHLYLRGTTGPDTFLISIILYALPFIAMFRADILTAYF